MNMHKQLIDSLSTAVLVFDANDRCLYSNEACQSLLYKSGNALSGKSIAAILGSEEGIMHQCGLARKHEQSVVLREVEIYLPEWHRQLLLDVTITPLELDEHSVLLLELVDRKEVQKLSNDTDMLARFKVATQIVRGLAHEIKNPLGGIRGAAQLLSMELDTSEAREYTSVITQEVDRLSELLNRMSGGSRSFERKQEDIHEPLTLIAELLKAEHGDILEFDYQFDSSLPGVELNIDQIKQALLNLLKNAVQWSLSDLSARENSVSVIIRTRAAHPDIMRSLMPKEGVRIQILDHGPGVDKSIVEQLFLPMVTRREGGTGLGLSISQEIAQNHGGFIELDLPPEQGGASFSMYLPYRQPGVPADQTGAD